MKIKQLIKKLNKLDPESEVLIASDMEGNNYNKLDFISIEKGLRFSNRKDLYSYGLTLITPEDVEIGNFSQEDYNKAKNCIILYP